ncbi:MAG: DNA mismatch repair protein MutS, partial [Polyangiales bacterium]
MRARGVRSKSKGQSRGPTPVMQQYAAAKAQHPQAVIFFRLGDFYEMFHDDAVEISALLGLTLTSRGEGPDGVRIPMAGVPHHAAASHIARLLAHGKEVALCEQMADPALCRGIVPRQVVRVITPALCLEAGGLDAKCANYLVALAHDAEGWALARFEYSTAELSCCRVADDAALLAELVRLEPRELVAPDVAGALAEAMRLALPHLALRPAPPEMPSWDAVQARLAADSAAPLVRARAQWDAATTTALSLALDFAAARQPTAPLHCRYAGAYLPADHLQLDEHAVRHLELVRTAEGERQGSLLVYLDETRTAMGARLLRR